MNWGGVGSKIDCWGKKDGEASRSPERVVQAKFRPVTGNPRKDSQYDSESQPSNILLRLLILENSPRVQAKEEPPKRLPPGKSPASINFESSNVI